MVADKQRRQLYCGYVKLILVITWAAWAKGHTLQLRALKTSVSELLQLHFNKIDAFVVTLCTDVQWFIDVILCSLLQAGVNPSQMFSGY